MRHAFKRVAVVHAIRTGARMPAAVHVIERKGKLWAVATDGCRLSVCRVPDDSPTGVWHIGDVRKFVRTKTGTLCAPGSVKVGGEAWADELPAAWEGFAFGRTSWDWSATVSIRELHSAGRMMKGGVGVGGDTLMRLERGDGMLRVRCRTSAGEGRVDVAAKLAGRGALTPSLRVDYVLAAVRHLPRKGDVLVRVPVAGAKSAAVRIEHSGEDFTVVMPDLSGEATKFTIGD